jgi:3-isopropylmalate dehydrogenase
MLIALLPGDGIGPEVIAEARRVLEVLALPELVFEEALVGGAAYKTSGHPVWRGRRSRLRQFGTAFAA